MNQPERLETWLRLWREAMPAARRHKPSAADWNAAIERFIISLAADLKAAPLGWWARVRLLHRLQQALTSSGVPGEAVRPLVLAVILRVYLA
jgi:hypothetical protein